MTRIGLTQRVEVVPDYGERRDCLDQAWTALLGELGLTPVPLPNTVSDPGALRRHLGLDGVILTGGNDLAELPDARGAAPERDRFERALLASCLDDGIPVLGICRGLQVLNVACGGRLVRVEGHVATRHRVEGDRFGREVNSFHGWGIPADGVGAGLEALGLAPDGTVEALRREGGGALGLMWHPERETPFDPADLALLAEIFQS